MIRVGTLFPLKTAFAADVRLELVAHVAVVYFLGLVHSRRLIGPEVWR